MYNKYYQPLEQFEIYNVNFLILQFYNKISILEILVNNLFIYLSLSCFVIYLFFGFSIRKSYILPKTWNFLIDSLFYFISSLFIQNLYKNAQRFIPIFFYLFIFILVINLIGFLPYSFTITSSIVITFSLAFSYWLGLTFFSIFKFNYKFFLFFIPHNIPNALKPILTVLEFISYLSRPFSLSIRLFANMLSGHTLVYILSSISLKLFKVSFFFFLLPIVLIIILNFLEAGVALLQAYVFYTLTILYFKECYYLSH